MLDYFLYVYGTYSTIFITGVVLGIVVVLSLITIVNLLLTVLNKVCISIRHSDISIFEKIRKKFNTRFIGIPAKTLVEK